MDNTARQHLNTVIDLAQTLLKMSDDQLDQVYSLCEEADDALTDAVNMTGA